MHRQNTIGPPIATPWLVCPKPNPAARLRLLCFHYAGGGSSIFCRWSDYLPPTVEVRAVQLPGRENRINERPFMRLLPLVQACSQAILPYLDKPVALFGHSMGALVSFELSRELRKNFGLLPCELFVSGCLAPQTPARYPRIHNLPEHEFLGELRRYHGTPARVLEHAELMQMFGPILRADFAVCETYVYRSEPPLQCPISAFGGLQDELANRSDLEGWLDQTSASFSLQMFPGDHFFLHTVQLLLLRAVSQHLRQLVGGTSSACRYAF